MAKDTTQEGAFISKINSRFSKTTILLKVNIIFSPVICRSVHMTSLMHRWTHKQVMIFVCALGLAMMYLWTNEEVLISRNNTKTTDTDGSGTCPVLGYIRQRDNRRELDFLVLEAGKISERKDLSNLDKGQIVMDKLNGS